MVVRKKNLLDAFREAASERRVPIEPPAAPVPPPSTSPPAAAPPRPAEPLVRLPRLEAPRPPSPIGRHLRGGLERLLGGWRVRPLGEHLLGDRRVRLVLLGAAFLVVIAWFAGRWTAPGEELQAAAPAPGEAAPGLLARGEVMPTAGVDPAGQNEAAARMGSAADRAFMNPANKVTVQVIQYLNDEAGMTRALATLDHLRRQEGLPAVGPIVRGRHLILAAGSAPRPSDLEQLLAYVRGLRGPTPRAGGAAASPFASAYVVNIDDLVQRR